jgi:hypothetical protein
VGLAPLALVKDLVLPLQNTGPETSSRVLVSESETSVVSETKEVELESSTVIDSVSELPEAVMLKMGVKVISAVSVIVKEADEVSFSSHPVKSNPEFGVAVIVIEVPSSKIL